MKRIFASEMYRNARRAEPGVTFLIEVETPDDYPLDAVDLLPLLGIRLQRMQHNEWPIDEVFEEVAAQ